MPKQSLARRIQNALTSENPRERYQAIGESLPAECAELEAHLGPLPVADLNDVPIEKAVRYAGRDADCTCRIDAPLAVLHGEHNLSVVEEIDLAALPYYERMARNGILVDRQHFLDFGVLLDLEKSQIGGQINSIAKRELNPNSGDQVANLLFKQLRLNKGRSVKKTPGGSRESTNEKVLQSFRKAHPVVPLILDYRELEKLKGTYVDSLLGFQQPDGRIYTRFKLTTSPNGQTAAEDPNLLAIPQRTELGREIRRGFIAPPGCVLATFDLDQWFMRVLAHLSGDEKMISVFQSGEDIHNQTASEMFKIPIEKLDKLKHRRPAKETGFGICNGITGVGLSAQFDKSQEVGGEQRSVEECDWLIEAWLDVYSGVREFQQREIHNCRRHGLVEDLFGRIRYIPNIHSAIESLRAEAERQSFTHVIQSTAHCLKKMMMHRIWLWLKDFWKDFSEYRCEPVLEVHDELLYECSDNDWLKSLVAEEIKDRMENAYDLAVPIGVHVAFARDFASMDK